MFIFLGLGCEYASLSSSKLLSFLFLLIFMFLRFFKYPINSSLDKIFIFLPLITSIAGITGTIISLGNIFTSKIILAIALAAESRTLPFENCDLFSITFWLITCRLLSKVSRSFK